MNSKLNVYITHFVPPRKSVFGVLQDFAEPRLSVDYLRSWARLVKHGTRGYQPWKIDKMTRVRRTENLNRLRYLHEVLISLSRVQDVEVRVSIFTNSIEHYNKINEWRVLETKVTCISKYSSFNSLHNSPWDLLDNNSPWLLTWEHKERLRQDVRNGSKSSVYLYLEDDELFCNLNFQYWKCWKDKLKAFRLFPSFLRTEWSFINENESPIDVFDNGFIPLSDLPFQEIEGVQFVQLPNPYSGLYIFDQEQAEEHLNGPAFSEVSSRSLTWWDIGARSTMGDQFVSVPIGFQSRSVVPVSSNLRGVRAEARVPHLPNIYLRNRDVPLGLTADNMFV